MLSWNTLKSMEKYLFVTFPKFSIWVKGAFVPFFWRWQKKILFKKWAKRNRHTMFLSDGKLALKPITIEVYILTIANILTIPISPMDMNGAKPRNTA